MPRTYVADKRMLAAYSVPTCVEEVAIVPRREKRAGLGCIHKFFWFQERGESSGFAADRLRRNFIGRYVCSCLYDVNWSKVQEPPQIILFRVLARNRRRQRVRKTQLLSTKVSLLSFVFFYFF